MIGYYRIAEQNILINSVHKAVHLLCWDYRIQNLEDNPLDLSLCTCQEDIEFERKRSAMDDKRAGRRIRNFSDSYLEELAVYRKLAEKSPASDILLIHGSCIAVDGNGYLFVAKSGIGKSTHTRLWKELFQERAVIVNDDKPLMKVQESGVTIFGTPWDGKHGLSSNMSVPLKAICFLERAKNNRIYPLNTTAVFLRLLQQVYQPSEPSSMKKTLELLNLLKDQISFFQLECNQDQEAAEIAYNTMKGMKHEAE